LRAGCLLIDLDNTLFDHRHSLRRGLAALRAEYPELFGGMKPRQLEEAHERALAAVYRRGMRAGAPAADLASARTQLFLELLEIEAKGAAPVELAGRYERAYLSERRASAGAERLLRGARQSGLPIAIVSDGRREVQREKAAAIGVLPLVDHLVTSEDAGAAKPDRRIFELAAGNCGVPLELAVMIGDDLERDVRGALACGAGAIHFDPAESGRGAVEAPAVVDLAAALPLLGLTP